ncbi:DinB family protein [Glycomyces halotolerans]
MEVDEVLADAFGRIEEDVHAVVDGLSQEELETRLGPDANSIAWLVWHIARVQDDHVSDVAGREQTWLADGWKDRFELPLDAADTGFGHTPGQVGRVRGLSGEALVGYYDAVHARTLDFVNGLTAPDLDRIVDTQWDPPVSLGVRLVSVVNDNQQHVGQAAFVRGLLESR